MPSGYSTPPTAVTSASDASTDDWESASKAQIARTQSIANQMIGMTIDEATSLAEGSQLIVRIVEQDGESFMVTMDFRTNRVNLVIENGVVTRVSVG